jgi:hypothetical protein
LFMDTVTKEVALSNSKWYTLVLCILKLYKKVLVLVPYAEWIWCQWNQPKWKKKVYNDLVRKMNRSSFTVPWYAMSDMIPNNPLMKIMDASKWNWVQLILSLPVVFLCVLDVFIRAYKSMCSLNMFTNWVWVAFLVWLDYFSCYFSRWIQNSWNGFSLFWSNNGDINVSFIRTTFRSQSTQSN